MRVESRSIVLTSNDSVFRTEFYPYIQLDKNAYHELALVELDMYHSIPNIDQTNNLFVYEYDGKVNQIEIPTGSYEIEAINQFIEKSFTVNNYQQLFDIQANNNTLKCIINIKIPNTKIYFDKERSLRDLLGFQSGILDTVGEHEGVNPVDILKVNTILVNCDAIDGSYLNRIKHPVLYSFFPNVPPGYKIVEKPNNIIYLPITSPILDNLQVWLTDQNMHPLNIRKEVVTLRLHLRSTYE